MKKVTISNRSVYYKYAEVTIELPSDIKDEDVSQFLIDNELKYTYLLDTKLSESSFEFGFGLGDGMDQIDSESETRYDIIDSNFGGHL